MSTENGETGINWALGEELLLAAEETNKIGPSPELPQTLATLLEKYDETSVYADVHSVITPTPEGIGAGTGDYAGTIIGFGYQEFHKSPGEAKPDVDSAVIMHLGVRGLNGLIPLDANEWRLNALPPELRDHHRMSRFVLGVPLIAGQKMMRLGQETTIDEATGKGEREPFSYQYYVQAIRSLTENKFAAENPREEVRLAAAGILLDEMMATCPYLSKPVAVESNYIRIPKEGDDKYRVVKGIVQGMLRKFVIDVYQDYESKEWLSDVQAVLWTPETHYDVRSGQMTPQQADRQPTTAFIPLSRPHMLANETGIQE